MEGRARFRGIIWKIWIRGILGREHNAPPRERKRDGREHNAPQRERKWDGRERNAPQREQKTSRDPLDVSLIPIYSFATFQYS